MGVRRIFNAGLGLGTILVATVSGMGEVSAKWVAQSDAWCRHRGLKPVCEIWVPIKKEREGERVKAGQIRSGMPSRR
jgi:hypothetical protein